jgi:Cu/Ag efflux protein CusF
MRRQEMFKKFALSAALIVFMVSVTGAAWAQEAPKQAPPNQPASPGGLGLQGKQFVGQVVKVDVKAKKLVVKGTAGEKQFDMAQATMGGYGSLADVKPGDKVAILFEEKGKKLTAKVVMNHSSMMKPAPTPAPAPAK